MDIVFYVDESEMTIDEAKTATETFKSGNNVAYVKTTHGSRIEVLPTISEPVAGPARYIMYVNVGNATADRAKELIDAYKQSTNDLRRDKEQWAFVPVYNEATRVEVLP